MLAESRREQVIRSTRRANGVIAAQFRFVMRGIYEPNHIP